MLPLTMACLFPPESMNAFWAHPATALSANMQCSKGERAKQKKLNVILFCGETYHQVVVIFRIAAAWPSQINNRDLVPAPLATFKYFDIIHIACAEFQSAYCDNVLL